MKDLLTLPVLAYHELYADRTSEEYCLQTMGPSCAMPRDIFRDHLNLITRNQIQTITFGDLSTSHLLRDRTGHRELILSFDDGHIGNYRFAYPLLAERKMKGVFFVTTDFINSKKMMSWDQVREMADNGMSIQSHGVSHEPFETLSPEKLEEELFRSKKIIEDKIGREVDTISLPHGSMHKRVMEKASDTGYRFVCTSIIDYFSFFSDEKVMTVPRISISGKMKHALYSDIINGTCNDISRWKRNQKMKYTIKKMIGITNYRRIYRIVNNIQLNK